MQVRQHQRCAAGTTIESGPCPGVAPSMLVPEQGDRDCLPDRALSPDPPIGIELSHDIAGHAGGTGSPPSLGRSSPPRRLVSGCHGGHHRFRSRLPRSAWSAGLSLPGIGYQLLFVWDTDQLRGQGSEIRCTSSYGTSASPRDPELLQRCLRDHPAVTPTAASFAMRASDGRRQPGTVDVVFASNCCRRRRFRILEPPRTAFLTRVLKLGHAR